MRRWRVNAKRYPSRVKNLLRFSFVLAFACGCSSIEDVGSSESRVTVCGQTTVKGIDVYHGDNGGNAINWTNVKNAGISFAFVKATESTDYIDPSFAKNWSGLKSAGLVRGAYHFFHSDVDPTSQANYFLATVGTVEQGDMLVLDLESANGETQTTIETNAATWMASIKSQTGVTPILYVSPAFLSSYTKLAAYPLWVANYGVNCPDVPSAWTTYTFWQSTGTGTLSALSGDVDLDTFNGTLTQLVTFANGTPPPSDAGTTDAGSPASDAGSANDAGSPTNDDAGAQTNDGGGAPTNEDAGIGENDTSHGCSASPRAHGRDASFAAMLLALVAMVKRRRRR
jgi:GH25 family lysozyme M1 (1,4-beta-N-acetylmuramidase)